MLKRLFPALAVMLFAYFLLFPLTAFANEDANDTAEAAVEEEYADADDDRDTDAVPEDSDIDLDFDFDLDAIFGELDLSALLGLFLGGGLSFDSPGYFTPDGTGTVMDNTYMHGSGLEFFTFTTEAGNVYYLVIDRTRERDNVFFLNAVTEWDLYALSQAEGGTGTGKPASSTSGIPPTPGGNGSAGTGATDEPDPPVTPPKKDGGNTGMIIFLLLGVAAVGGAAYYFKIVKPKKQLRDEDDDEGTDDYDDGYGSDDGDEDFGDTGDDGETGEEE